MTPFDCPVLAFRLVDGGTVGVTLDTTSPLQHTLGLTVAWTGRLRLAGIDVPEIDDKRQAAAGAVVAKIVAAWMAERRADLRASVTGVDSAAGRLDGDLFTLGGVRLSAYLLARRAVHAYTGEGPRPSWTDGELTRIASLASEP